MSKPEEMLEQLDHPPSSGPTKWVSVVVVIVGVAAVGLLAWYLNSSLGRIETAVGDIEDIVGAQQAALSARIVQLEDFIRDQGQEPPENRGQLDNPPTSVGGESVAGGSPTEPPPAGGEKTNGKGEDTGKDEQPPADETGGGNGEEGDPPPPPGPSPSPSEDPGICIPLTDICV